MPADVVPYVGFVIAMFGVFVVTLGGTAMSQALGDRRDPSRSHRAK